MQAAYNIGGHTISVDMIQSSILGCRLPRPGQVNPIPDINIKRLKSCLYLPFNLKKKKKKKNPVCIYDLVFLVEISCWAQHVVIHL